MYVFKFLVAYPSYVLEAIFRSLCRILNSKEKID